MTIWIGDCPPDGHLDPFLGAGTTALAAYQTGRPWTGIELNAEFAALAAARLAKGLKHVA